MAFFVCLLLLLLLLPVLKWRLFMQDIEMLFDCRLTNMQKWASNTNKNGKQTSATRRKTLLTQQWHAQN